MKNGLFSRFIERLLFPSIQLMENLLDLVGRTITGHNAKYVNSPQTKAFNKSKLLYGYHLAKKNL